MSLRHPVFPHATPSPPSSPHQSPSPLPANAAQEKHRAQLASYRRDPSKVSPRSSPRRESRLRIVWNAGRRLSGVLEEGTEGDDGKNKRRPLRFLPFQLRSKLLDSPRKIRLWLYVVAVISIWLLVIRPVVVGWDTTPAASQRSAGLQRKKGNVSPLFTRKGKVAERALLPPVVAMRTTPDHKVERGLLQVDMESQVHPIYQLIRDSREQWDAKVARQSRTLKEAVEEYKRRYKQAPPKGFDKWWSYVVDNEVPLPDEYDRIHHDLLPFRALSPADLNKRIERAANLPDTYTLRVKSGSVRTSATYNSEAIWGADFRLEDQAELLRPISRWIGDMSVVYSVHDTASSVVSWDHRRELIEHVEEGEYFSETDEIDLTFRGWPAACPPQSRLRTSRFAHLSSTPTKSFISSHSSLMDICDHPELVPLHGTLSGKVPAVGDLTPIFVLSKTNLHSDILGIPTEQWVEDTPALSWGRKTDSRLLWRGSNTGVWHSGQTTWRSSHRTRLVRMASKIDIDGEYGGVEVLPAPKSLRGQMVGNEVRELTWEEVNEHYLDVGFVSGPIQCDKENGTCEQLQEEFNWLERIKPEQENRYKYILDVDGNAWSARFKRLLSSGSLISKSNVMPEWWTDRIQPWVHHVPVQLDYSDLYDGFSFSHFNQFRGDMNDRAGEDALAAYIASAGNIGLQHIGEKKI
ncbi:hypothetical protein TREMEDRAFT_61649 [Tremella mesenterica DSM 1558]|uniref:uncharacterized protein n=1 Tax=Tremella mesenterica (strain ATCC 24925 / CBS 8224 / DSM 1558 / NBRC 9311 / NRRL Y-6157 / RJB 2259-6 / UBC 559-6) TaxID=578456 RepID=UPI0003F4932B|nr:uncharacterized protein TREMEDRAFT_61649 [Tremella mesenterica DSM 1558]EIW69878.1 hypothetical protein TREMEDRAFT_61649 [Tremella mesenterica DSM 1558]